MNVTFYPSAARGTIKAPPSKSMAHRALICAALSSQSKVFNIDRSRDVEATAECLKTLGADIELIDGGMSLGGLDPESIPEGARLFCDESGSTLRFLLPLCMLSEKKITLTGGGRLMSRPLGVYADISKRDGGFFELNGNELTVRGGLSGGKYVVPGNVSSQFITGLLFALPSARSDSSVVAEGVLESASYIELTLDTLARFGIEFSRKSNVILIPGNQRFKSCDQTVEGDYSNAAFLDAFNLLGGDVTVTGLNPDSKQGDRVYKRFFHDLGSNFGKFDLTDCPDLGPLMFALAAAGQGAEFSGTERLRLKESDRIAAMTAELAKFGVGAEIRDNSVIILNDPIHSPHTTLYGHNDHRIVMALSVLCSKYGGTVAGAEAVAKSYPGFFDTLKELQIGMSFDET